MKKIRYLWLLAMLPFLSIAQNPSSQMVTTAARNYMQVFCPDMPSQIIKNFYENAISVPRLQISGDAMMNLIEFRYGGWILMSNDINVEPVLAYSESGIWESDTSLMPPALVELLCDYIEQINEIKASVSSIKTGNLPESYLENQAKWQGLQSKTSSYIYQLTQSKAGAVPNLLIDDNGNEIMWGQAWNFNGGKRYKYNKFTTDGCKISDDNNTGHKFLGCAAVAMGQLMWYWNFPPQYDWDKMPYMLTEYGSTVEEENNIAHFLKTCGDKADITYGCNYSWTTTNKVEEGMQKMHFPQANKRRRGDIDDGDWWPNLIKRQLNNGWPVIYRGDKNDFSGEKHFWVVSGYNEENKFYCNWGWGSSDRKYNGYYNLHSLKFGDYDFRKNNMIVRNIYPDWSDTEDWTGRNITKGNDEELRVFCTNARMNNITLKGNSQSKIAFTGELIIDGAFTVSDNATLTLACYDKELSAQTASTNSLQMAKGDQEGNNGFGMDEDFNHDFYFEEYQTDNSFVLNPNPSKGEFSISMNPYTDDSSIKDLYLYDSQGRLCYQTQFKGNFTTTNIPDLPNGVYIVRVVTNGTSFTQKLLIR